MAYWIKSSPENINTLFSRGGLYELNEAIIFSIMVFIFIGTIDLIDSMPSIVDTMISLPKV